MTQHNFRLFSAPVTNLVEYLMSVIFRKEDWVGFIELLLATIILKFLVFRYDLQSHMLLLFILLSNAATLFYLTVADLRASDAFFE